MGWLDIVKSIFSGGNAPIQIAGTARNATTGDDSELDQSSFGNVKGDVNIDKSKGATDAITGERGRIEQMGVGEFHGPVELHKYQGLGGEDVAEIIRTILELSRVERKELVDKNRELTRENESLQRYLAAAIQRTEEAEDQGEPQAKDALEALQENADPKRLLQYLVKLRDAGKANLLELNRELTRENESLQRDMAAAVQRTEQAEDQGEPEAKDALESLRNTGDTTRLLEYLVKLRDVGQANLLELNREIAAVAYLTGQIDTATTALRAILSINPDDLDAINRMGHINSLRGNLDEAVKAYSRVLEIAGERSDDTWRAIAYGNLGLIYQIRGELDKAEQMHRKSLEISERLGRQEGMAATYGNLGLIHQIRGDLDKAEQMHRKSLEINERLGCQEGMAIQYGNLANISRTHGDLDKAEQMLRKSLEIDERLGRQEGMANAFGNLGLIYQDRSELDKAEQMHRKSLEIDEHLGQQEGMASDYGNLGSVCEQRGEIDKAKEFWTKARDIFAKIGAAHMADKLQGWLDELDKKPSDDG